MPTISKHIEGIGEVIFAKKRGNRHIRLSITPAGRVRVSLPYWLPYKTAENFAKQKRAWIIQNRQGRQQPLLRPGDRIGPRHTIEFLNNGASRITTKITADKIKIFSGLDNSEALVQARAAKAAEKVLKQVAEAYLEPRLKLLAKRHGFNYQKVVVRKLTARWGSCSKDKVINLSYFLVQLPIELSDYVLLHELVHTEVLEHGPRFWGRLEQLDPAIRQHRQKIRQWRPMLQPTR